MLENLNANMLVGEGAMQFAKQQNFVLEDNESLLSSETKQAFHVSTIKWTHLKMGHLSFVKSYLLFRRFSMYCGLRFNLGVINDLFVY